MSSGMDEEAETDESQGALFQQSTSFWCKLQARLNMSLPTSLIPMLDALGCANEAALRDMNDQKIERLVTFARRVLSKKIKCEEERKRVFGPYFFDSPTEFEFTPGHIDILIDIGQKLKTFTKPVAPAKFLSPRVSPAASKKPSSATSETTVQEEDWSPDKIALEQKRLQAKMEAYVKKEFKLCFDSPEPLLVVSITDARNGSASCVIGDCKKYPHVFPISRTSKRPWSTQNVYRHVRVAHVEKGEKEAGAKRQKTLTEMDIRRLENSEDTPDEDGGSNNPSVSDVNTDSKWKAGKYCRSERNKRQLERAGNICHKLTDFWPIIQKIESIVRENERLNSTIRLLLERLSDRATASPTVSNQLHALMASASKNCDRSRGGERYDPQLVLFCVHIYMTSGPKAYSDLYLNLKGIVPSKSSVLRSMNKSKDVPVQGEFRFQKLEEFITKRSLPRRVNISMDATRNVSRIQYCPSTNQLVGFVPHISEQGIPEVSSFPATSEVTMRKYFEEETVGSSIMVVMARPLTDDAPSFCLCAYATDNKFTAFHVNKMWKYIEKELAKVGITVATFASDGDWKCLAAMRDRMFKPCTNSLAWHFWFRANIDISGDSVCVQDMIHIATKLRNLLLRDVLLCMGNYIVSASHLRFLVNEVSKDQHELTEGDIDSNDRMNFRSMEKMYSENVLQLLEEKVPDSEGTRVFLEMARSVTDAFLDRSLTPAQRIQLMWKAVFFFRVWRKWVMDHPSYTISRNFLTTNCYLCIEINAHALILLTRYHRDHAGEAIPFTPWHWGSQACEQLFRMLRSMTSTFSTVINFTVLEFLHRVSRAGLEEDIRLELGSKYQFSGNRRSGKERESATNLNTLEFPSDAEILQVIRETKCEAQTVASRLGIGTHMPTVFESMPEVEESYGDLDMEERDTDGDSACIQSDPGPDDPDVLDLAEDELVGGVSLFSGEVTLPCFPDADLSPDSPFVQVKNFHGHASIIRKSSFTWMLTRTSKPSTDRRYRVQEGEAPQQVNLGRDSSWRAPSKEEFIHVGDWCAFQDEGDSMLIGRVLGFRYLTGKNKKYSLLWAPTTPPQGKEPRGVAAICNWYVVDDMGELQRVEREAYCSIDSRYKCTITRPLIQNEHLVLDIKTFSLMA